MTLRDQIAKYAYEAADKYVRHKTPLNDTVFAIALRDNLNSEMIKRICEESNKNVYLAIFKSEGADKTKIEFPRAEDNVIMEKIQTENADAADYILPPGPVTPVVSANSDVPARDLGLTNSRDAITIQLNKIENMLSSVKNMMSQEKKASEIAYQKLYGSIKKLASDGDSFGDICKLAMRYASHSGIDMKGSSEVLKFAESHLSKEMVLDYTLTKTADGTLNPDFQLFKEFEACVRGIEKVAGWTELHKNMEAGAVTVRGVVTGKGIEKNATARNLHNFMKGFCK